MSELTLYGLICDLFGALVILLPETPLRRLVRHVGTLGRLELGRIVVFERNEELPKERRGFDALNDFLCAYADEPCHPEDVYKISVNQNSRNVRLHRSVPTPTGTKQDYVKCRYPDFVEATVRRRIDGRIYALGAVLLVVGFGLQIVDQLLFA